MTTEPAAGERRARRKPEPGPQHPRHYFVVPQAFGTGRARVPRELRQAGRRERDWVVAAEAQHVIVQTITATMRDQRLSRASLSRAARVADRRLSRIITGEAWAQLYDLVAIGRVLGQDLVRFQELHEREWRSRWVGEHS